VYVRLTCLGRLCALLQGVLRAVGVAERVVGATRAGHRVHPARLRVGLRWGDGTGAPVEGVSENATGKLRP
jgi:hypothetical protein